MMLKKVVTFVAINIAVFFLIAIGLILSQPMRPMTVTDSLDFSERFTGSTAPLHQWTAPDGSARYYRTYGKGTDAFIILLHGSSWHGAGYDDLAQRVADAANARVIVPDLRGHGPHAQTPGDVDHLRQLEGDITDLHAALYADEPKFVVAGFSSGGGLALKYAGSNRVQGAVQPDGVVLLAPYVHHTAPTIRPNTGGWTKVMVRRFIGVSMLNAVGLRALNGMRVVQFNMPYAFIARGAVADYSYRMQKSLSPTDWEGDIRALPPYLVVIGTGDEAFYADQFEPTFAAINPKGQFHLVPDASHIGVLRRAETAQNVARFVNDLTP